MSDDWRFPSKPDDLRERLFQFACVIVRLVEYLHTRGPVAKALSRMRVLRKTGHLTRDHDPVIVESDELVRILATLVNRHRGGR